MQDTRDSLTEKLEALEQQVVDTVQEARTAVTETVASVREAVHDTVEETVSTVKKTFDLRRQVERHPWGMVSGSVALGYFAGCLANRTATPPAHRRAVGGEPAPAPLASVTDRNGGPYRHPGPDGAAQESRPEQRSTGQGGLAGRFQEEFDQLKSLAIGAAIGVARDLVAQSSPEPLRDQVVDIMDSLTTKLGGRPVKGQLLT
jgi:ElaB/YqjD/DUF883 family membrane-anchored ribosome-binding protein